eukprot:scaffold37783_cov23-Tisochrysis_lutea.AAC.1
MCRCNFPLTVLCNWKRITPSTKPVRRSESLKKKNGYNPACHRAPSKCPLGGSQKNTRTDDALRMATSRKAP